MDITGLGGLSTALAQAGTGDAVGILVLKKAIALEAQSALQLLQAVPQATVNPANLGNSVDVRA